MIKANRLVWLGLLCLVCADVSAHSRSVSYSFWQIGPNGAQVRARVAQLELTRLGLHPEMADYRQRVGALLTDRLRLYGRQGPCMPKAQTPPSLRGGFVIHRWQVDCAQGPPMALSSDLLLDAVPSHLHFARVQQGDSAAVERVLTESGPVWQIGAGAPADVSPSGFADYFELGVAHIAGGWDHLAFLLALVVLASRLRELVLLATGFTLAHSLTLALAVLGWANPVDGAVEALIALSIVFVAVENAWRLEGGGPALPCFTVAGLLALIFVAGELPAAMLFGLALFAACYFTLAAGAERPQRWRLAVTFAFGLFHGFGFAGVLADLELSAERLVPALLGFNLGVEAGQLLLLLVAWPVLDWLPRQRLPAPQAVTAGTAAMGIYWLVVRVAG